jgi:hypothetical protein
MFKNTMLIYRFRRRSMRVSKRYGAQPTHIWHLLYIPDRVYTAHHAIR